MPYTVFIYAVLAGLVPSFIWLAFWLREDTRPEPRFMIALCFVSGALAVIPAIFLEKYIAGIVSDNSLTYSLWAMTEEVIKLFVIALVALQSDYNDEPIDAMIYCVAVALGFAALENSLFILGPLANGDVVASVVNGSLRFIGATLVHVVSSSLIGFAIGYVFYRRSLAKFLAVIIGLCTAIALHAAFNLSIITASPAETLKTFGWIWGAVVILIVLFEEIKVVRPPIRTFD
ncbi:MAG: hypothetical protein A3B11_02350 [Candidatus Taylorbacteria bacterium RIFCSPLOWO2_01_FULL_44_26]|uniref:Protease PrsW n=2 Tax=Candidatus Tayloriibacteriota TaxID=1817919 RepID=A0A1G2MKA6_9BACT|nr:MAG: hypothetical protein A3D50_01390 [Candidatus Taylorbacteria bacterium RIFCSPHIGHO2_02_FULL_44_12]OHA30803.1 MAG: hypothetical protein A3B11_02350 [Candidatus Taylorbacteria bacterium RIFCSPLOWO2_01_FULL_44_26]